MVDTATKLRRAFIATPKIFYAALLIVLCILYADLRGRPRTFNSPETRILERIFRNVNQNPIMQIQLMTGTTCPADFASVTLGTWPGTIGGCLCGTTLTPGSCSTSGCTTIPNVAAQHITKWKGAQFCIKRVSAFSFPNQTANIAAACTGNTPQACESSGICVGATDTCPITSLSFTFGPDGLVTGVTAVNTFQNSPVTDLMVSLFDFPCMDPKAMPYTRTKQAYVLSVIPENGCLGTGLSDHLVNVDNQDLTAVFTENSLVAALSLPGYSAFITNEKAYFVALEQYQLETAVARCGSVDPVKFTEVQKDEDFYISRVYPLTIAAIVVMSIKFATILIELILRIRKNEEEDHWLNLFAGGNLLLLLGACTLFIIIGGFGAHAVIQLSPNTSYFKFLANNQCFEQTVVNRIFQVFQGNISNFWAIVWLSITLLIVACSAIIIVIILGIINHCYGKRGEFSSYYKSVGKKLGRSKKQAPVNKSTANIEMLLAK